MKRFNWPLTLLIVLSLAVWCFALCQLVPAAEHPGIVTDVRILIDEDTIWTGIESPVDSSVLGWERRLREQIVKVAVGMRRNAAAITDPCAAAPKALALQKATRILQAARAVPCELGPRQNSCTLQVPELECAAR